MKGKSLRGSYFVSATFITNPTKINPQVFVTYAPAFVFFISEAEMTDAKNTRIKHHNVPVTVKDNPSTKKEM